MRVASLLFAVATMGVVSPAAAAEAAGAIDPLEVLGPLGIHPALTLGALGAMHALGWLVLPGRLGVLSHPEIFVAALVVGSLLMLSKSTKLTKAFAGIVEPLESVVAIAMALMFTMPAVKPGVLQAGVLDQSFVAILAVSSVLSVVVVRTAVDILVWIMPIPFLDSALEAGKASFTAGLLALAVLAPGVAIVVNVLILFVAALLARWAMRIVVFGGTTAFDLTLGKLGFSTPFEESGELMAFASRVPGLPRLTRARLRFEGGHFRLRTTSIVPLKPRDLDLGPSTHASIRRGVVFSSLSAPEGTILLPPRYAGRVESLARSTGAHYESALTYLGPAQRSSRVL